MEIWWVHCNWERGNKCVLFGPIYSAFSGKGWALGISCHCLVCTALSWHSSALLQSPARHPKVLCQGNCCGIGVWLLWQSLPAVLPQCRGCDVARADGFCWAALGSTAQQKLMDFHCHFFTPCRLFLPRAGPWRSCMDPATAGVWTHLQTQGLCPKLGNISQSSLWNSTHTLSTLHSSLSTDCQWISIKQLQRKNSCLLGNKNLNQCWRWMSPSRAVCDWCCDKRHMDSAGCSEQCYLQILLEFVAVIVAAASASNYLLLETFQGKQRWRATMMMTTMTTVRSPRWMK